MFSKEFCERWDWDVEFVAAVKVMELRELFRFQCLRRQEGVKWWFAGGGVGEAGERER
jgi:hypothetical protein